jgi:predicted GTPase
MTNLSSKIKIAILGKQNVGKSGKRQDCDNDY